MAKLEGPFQQLQDLSVSMVRTCGGLMITLTLVNEQALQDSAEDLFEDNVADDDVEVLVHALRKQSEGLEGLAETLRKDLRDMTIIRQRLNL